MIVYDESIEGYHAAPQLSTSKLSDYSRRGPRYFASRHVTRSAAAFASTEAQVFGQRFESLLCEQAVLDARYAIKPDGMSFATVDGRAWKKAQLAAGKTIVDASDVEAMNGMRESFWENETAVELVRACKQQVTVRAPYAGTPGIQSRPDWLTLEGCAVTGFQAASVDLKTTIALAKLTSGRGVAEYQYHAQAALCRKTLHHNGHAALCYLIACEKVAPYRCQVIQVSAPWLDAGWQWCERQLGKLAQHYATNEWPRVEREMVSLGEPPAWIAAREYDEDAA